MKEKKYVPKLRSPFVPCSEGTSYTVAHNRMQYECNIIDTATSARNASRQWQDLNDTIGLKIQKKKWKTNSSEKYDNSPCAKRLILSEDQHGNNDSGDSGTSGIEVEQVRSETSSIVKILKSDPPDNMLNENTILRFMNSVKKFGSPNE